MADARSAYPSVPSPMLDARGLSFDPSQVLVMILAGGEGKRLCPLTLDRAKPAVPFGGRYRIIDIVLSNFVNSGLTRIKVLTQYKSASLEEHIARVWRLSPMLDQFIETIPAQQRTGKSWFKGSADAVYQCQHVITDEKPELVCIFGGDHVYKMDVRQMIDAHLAARTPTATVAAIPVPRKRGARLRRHRDRRRRPHHRLPREGAEPADDAGQPATCASRRWATTSSAPTTLMRELERDAERRDEQARLRPRHPPAHGRGRAATSSSTTSRRTSSPARSPRDRGYWRDIGTIEAYWDAQMDLIAIQPLFNLYNQRWPIRTGVTHDPPAKFVFRDEAHARVGIATDSLVCHGCIISGGRIHRSVLGVGCRINSFSEVEESVLFERVRIGRHAKIRRCHHRQGRRDPAGQSRSASTSRPTASASS